jgi:hypothetical protein
MPTVVPLFAKAFQRQAVWKRKGLGCAPPIRNELPRTFGRGLTPCLSCVFPSSEIASIFGTRPSRLAPSRQFLLERNLIHVRSL